ncbi:glutamate racemase [Hypnocyclicus thermotrophus]|uniref:Glutamate racemase n=1 Tax=Hypnocyclicus thermotrophus TaxID=1627895 RepID=A0AA46I6A6_9FUSO|nr:glutamate racemase [Hypnocyclicus thermotrophus]TDT71442.1 glutamate racemase [Hypnocyclicus thermotrophus]
MINTDNRAIGIFDSGFGGLTVLKEIEKKLSNENIIYFGDTARLPYGSKSKETIIKYSKEIYNFLKKKNVKLIVIACNTASSFALDTLQSISDIPVIGVIKAGSRCASRESKGNILVIGTKGTIKSEVYKKEIHSISNNINVYQQSCPLFVPLVEEGMLDDKITILSIKKYLDNYIDKIDSILLGCTHYPLLKESIQNTYNKNINIINPAEEVAEEVFNILKQNNQLANNVNRTLEFYVSDDRDKFIEYGSLFLGYKIKNVKEIDIEEYKA